MAADLRNADGKLMTNEELKAYTEKYDDVLTKISDYDDVENTDGTQAYENLSSALTYLFYAGIEEKDYLDDLIKAYVDIESKDEEYIYSKESVQIYNDFVTADGDWADYKTDVRKVNGEDTYANTQRYYYSVVGKVTSDDAEAIIDGLKSDLKDYPESDETWWEGLTTVAKVFFIIGMVVAGLLIIGGVVVLIIVLKRKKANKTVEAEDKMQVDITDEKDVNVYADENVETLNESADASAQDSTEETQESAEKSDDDNGENNNN
jgi:hypothetical protein